MTNWLLSVIILLFLVSVFNIGYSQVKDKDAAIDTVFFNSPDTLFSERRPCPCKKEGFNLIIRESTFRDVDDICSPFTYTFLFSTSDSLRISLINKLLEYRYDTGMSCIPVHCYSNSVFKKFGNEFSSVDLKIQIMALYHINLIAFAQYSVFYYSPYPVLYDTIDKKIINNDPEKIEEVFSIYELWYSKNLQTGFKNYSFPLLNSRYIWVHGENDEKMIFERFPLIKSDYKYRIGQPVNEIYNH